MASKISNKEKDNSNNLFEQGENNQQVNEPSTAYALSTDIQKSVQVKLNVADQIPNKEKDTDQVKSNYLASSINFLCFLSNSFDLANRKILPFMEAYFIVSASNRISHKPTNNLLDEIFEDSFLVEKNNSELSKIFFYLISSKNDIKNLSADSKKLYVLLKKLVEGIEEVKSGKKTIRIVLDLLKKSKETKRFSELSKFIHKYEMDDFSQLNEIADRLITLLSTTKQDDNYLQTWKIIIGSYIWVLRYSSQSVEVLIDDLFKKKNSQLKELHIVLIGVFTIKLFHSGPSWKPIGLGYQIAEKMKILQPLAEIFYNPSIITSLTSDPKKQEEYFWTYVWEKPYSIFEKPKVRQVKKYQKKMIEAEEEVIVQEKTYGDFITISGDPKPTGIIRIKTKV